MPLVLQMRHDAAYLDVGKDDHVLHLFQCASSQCSTYDPNSGCTAGMVLRQGELGSGLVELPIGRGVDDGMEAGTVGLPSASGPDRCRPQQNGELWLTHWTEHDDGILPENASAFFDPVRFDMLRDGQAAPYGFDFRWNTRVAAVPLWSGNGIPPAALDIPRPPFAFLMQIDNMVALPNPVPKPGAAGSDLVVRQASEQPQRIERVPETHRKPNAPRFVAVESGDVGGCSAHFADFALDGSMYVFLDRTTAPPRPLCFWAR